MRLFRVSSVISILFLVYADNVIGLSLKLPDIGRAVIDTGVGVVSKVPDVIPRPEDLFQLGKNAIAGYPFDLAFKAINTFCKYKIRRIKKSKKRKLIKYFIF